MGGTKKKPITAVEKAQMITAKKSEKKGEKKGEVTVAKKITSWTAPQFSDEYIEKTLKPLKAITLYSASKALNLQPSVTNQLLKSLKAKGVIKKVGGYSGHYVYAFVS